MDSPKQTVGNNVMLGVVDLAYWLLKTEPETFSFADLVRLRKDRWNGVRNFAAIKHIDSMQQGDLAFIYHTGKEKSIVGVAEVVSEPYPDPEADNLRFKVVDIVPRYYLNRPVTLHEIKSKSIDFGSWELVKYPRLSVMPVPDGVWKKIIEMS